MGLQQNLRIGDILLREGLITEAQLVEALGLQKTNKKKLGDILIERGIIHEVDLLRILADIYQLPIIDLDHIVTDQKLLSSFTLEVLQKNKVFPIEVKDQSLFVATNDPLDVAALQEIRYVSGYPVKPVLASLDQIMLRLNQSYESIDATRAMSSAQEAGSQDTPIITLVNSIISKAIKEGASDIHVEPQKDHLRIRFRIDGILFKKMEIQQILQRKVISRLKIMANLDVAENRKPQDGRISIEEGGHNYDIRVSTLLDIYGESMTLRILNAKSISHNLESLGLTASEIEQMKSLISRPHGVLLVTGPTGAGKTTTLYSVLNSLNNIETNIITVEDPVEYQLDGITQTNINPFTGYSFATAIRHILRHDPDIIMVGEIRDIETAEISVRASLTGHLVLATLHTNSAAGAITRLQDMNVESFLLSSTVIGVIAQRLVRRLCPHCKKEALASPEVEQIICRELKIKGPLTIAKHVGCNKCFGTGYSGRVGLFEILRVDPEVRKLILNKANEQEITKAMVERGMNTLRMAGYHKVLDKLTSYEEVVRITLTEDM